MRFKEELAKLRDTDIYSLILFSLYKLKDINEYSTLSELAYILDKESLLKLCQYFGGLTIKIPTIEELETLVYALVLYQKVNIDGESFKDVYATMGYNTENMKDIKKAYIGLCDVLKNYSFVPRGE